MQNHTMSMPDAFSSGEKIGTRISTSDIQSRKKPPRKARNSTIPSRPQAPSFRASTSSCVTVMPPAPRKAPVMMLPPSRIVMIMVEMVSVFMIDSCSACHVKVR